MLYTIYAIPKPFHSELAKPPDLEPFAEWPVQHQLRLHTLPKLPITPPPHPTPPQPGNGFGKLLPFQESQPSFGWPVTKKFPPIKNIERLYCISLAIEYT